MRECFHAGARRARHHTTQDPTPAASSRKRGRGTAKQTPLGTYFLSCVHSLNVMEAQVCKVTTECIVDRTWYNFSTTEGRASTQHISALCPRNSVLKRESLKRGV